MGADQLVKAGRYLRNVVSYRRAPLKHSAFKRRPNTKSEPIKGDAKPPHTKEVATTNANHKREDAKPNRWPKKRRLETTAHTKRRNTKREPKRVQTKPPRIQEDPTPNAKRENQHQAKDRNNKDAAGEKAVASMGKQRCGTPPNVQNQRNLIPRGHPRPFTEVCMCVVDKQLIFGGVNRPFVHYPQI